MLDAVLVKMNNFGRIPVCGMISGYNGQQYGLQNAMQIIGKRLLLQGFIVSDYMAEFGAEFAVTVGGWVKEGKLKYKEHETVGIEKMPSAFVELFKGENFGKAVIRI